MTNKDTKKETYKPKSLYSHDQIGVEIDKFKKKGDNVAKHGQRIALSVISDLQRTRNMDYVHKLIENMPNGTKVNAMKEWLIAFGQVKEDRDAKNGLAFCRDTKEADIEGAMDKPWWLFAPEKPYLGFDLIEMLGKLVDKAEKASKQEDEEKKELDTIPESLLRELTKLRTRYEKVQEMQEAA